MSTGGPYTNVLVSTTFTTYTDSNVVDGVTFYYVVSAANSGGESANSPEVNATPLLSPIPTFINVTTNFGLVNLTWSASAGATSYNLKRSPSSGGPYTIIASPIGTTYADNNVINGSTYYYVVSALNPGGESLNSPEVNATPPIPPPPAPRVGWYDWEGNNQTGFFTVLHPVSSYVTHNDLLIAVDPVTNGLSTYFIAGPAPLAGNPGPTNGTTTPFYQDGLAYPYNVALPVTTVPDLIVKAVNVNPGSNGLSGPITTAEFIFQVANPTINGNNAAQFSISDITTNANFWYTIDGTDPTNSGILPSTSFGPVGATNGNPTILSLNATTNFLFKVRAYRNGYQPSGIAVQAFSTNAFIPNSISFGFESGEASSDFVASPGQTFYAPVTMIPLPSTTIYGLQFNLTVTNISPTPTAPIAPGTYDFESLLIKPVPGELGVFETIPPCDVCLYQFAGSFARDIGREHKLCIIAFQRPG